MALPYPGKVYVPFDILTAQELNEDVANVQALAAGTGFNTGAIPTAAIANSAITTAKVNDGAITFAKTSGIWWEELARITLASPSTSISIPTIPTRKFLHVRASLIPGGSSLDVYMRFNGDSGTNYAWRYDGNNGGIVNTTNTDSLVFTSGGAALPRFIFADIMNLANQPKLFKGEAIDPGTSGAGNLPSVSEISGKWTNNTTAISTITFIDALSTSNAFGSGTEIVVLGRN